MFFKGAFINIFIVEHKERWSRSLNVSVKLGRLGGISANSMSKHKKPNSYVIKGEKRPQMGLSPSFLQWFDMGSENFTESHKKSYWKRRYYGSNFLSSCTSVIQDISAEVSASAMVWQQQEQ